MPAVDETESGQQNPVAVSLTEKIPAVLLRPARVAVLHVAFGGEVLVEHAITHETRTGQRERLFLEVPLFLLAEYEFWEIEHGEHIQSRRSRDLELRGGARQR